MGLVKEIVIRGLLVIALVWCGFAGWEVHKEIRSRQLRQPDSYPVYQDIWPAVSSFIGMLLAQLLFRSCFAGVARSMIPKKARWNYNVWGAKVTRCCDSVFKCSYYATMTLWTLSLLRDQPWVPWVLGGSGNTRFCWTDGYPFQPVSTDLRRLYLTSVGYHMSEVIMLLLQARHPDFWEMMLHHAVSCSLVVFSYGLNYIRVGSLVMLLHGATDILIYASKALVDTPNIRCIATSYFALIVAYAWFRIYVFPAYIMRSAWVESIAEAGAENIYGWGFINFSLCVLLLLHMYWFGLIVKIGFVFRKTGQPRDLQSNLSALDMQDKKKAS